MPWSRGDSRVRPTASSSHCSWPAPSDCSRIRYLQTIAQAAGGPGRACCPGEWCRENHPIERGRCSHRRTGCGIHWGRARGAAKILKMNQKIFLRFISTGGKGGMQFYFKILRIIANSNMAFEHDVRTWRSNVTFERHVPEKLAIFKPLFSGQGGGAKLVNGNFRSKNWPLLSHLWI